MSKKSLIILLFSLFILISSVNAITAYEYSFEKYFDNYHEINGTIIDMDNNGNYLIDVNGTTFFLYSEYTYEKFNIGDKVTVKGTAYNEKGNLHWMGSEFHAKYDGKRFPILRITYKPEYRNDRRVNFGSIWLADGFVRGESSSTTKEPYSTMTIINGTITSGSNVDDKTKCTVYIGKEYSGVPVKISVLYSSDGDNLNKAHKVDKTVSSSGEVTIYTNGPFEYFPDKAKVTIYDDNGNKLDTITVKLSTNSKPQYFYFNGGRTTTAINHLKDGKKFADCKKYFPEASETVLAHVFNEADSNTDGVLSEKEFAIFKKVRDHTKHYAVNVKNEYPTEEPSSDDKSGYCADHGRVKVNGNNECPYCIKLGYDDTRTKTSSW